LRTLDIEEETLPKTAIEGKTLKTEKRKLDILKGKIDSKLYGHKSHFLDVWLTLHAVSFINPSGVTSVLART
jgi:hypothetical protein